MGADPSADANRPFDLGHSRRRVRLSPLYLDFAPLTNAEYQRFGQATKRPLPFFWSKAGFRQGPDFPNHPVAGFSHGEATAFCQ
jgi:formylglycine-generating enzyme required for sulfatase activity